MTTVPSGIWPIDPNVTTGTDLATYLNTWMDAFQSMQASPTRPPLITKGGVWAKTIGAADIALMFYDGTADHTIGSVIGGAVSFGGVVASAAAPAAPSNGDTWIDTSAAGAPVFKVYNGTVWGVIGPDAAGTINAKALTVNGNNYPSAGALSNRNILINGNLKVNQRGLSVAAVANGEYGEDRWKKTAGGMTQIIEPLNYLPTTVYTLSGTGVTTQQITSPASGNWTLPDIPVTARLVQLELGDTATPFEHRSIGQELALCQRYYQLGKFSSYSAGATQLSVTHSFITEMRRAPLVTRTGYAASTSETGTVISKADTNSFYAFNSAAYVGGAYTLDAEL